MNALLPVLFGTGYSLGPLVMGNVLGRTSIGYTWNMISVILIISTLGMVLLDRFEQSKNLVKE